MRHLRHVLDPRAIIIAALCGSSVLSAQHAPTIDQFLSPASPLELSSSRKADRVAWVAYERGMRNVYTAAAPDFAPVRLTKFLDDDGTDVTNVRVSDDGSIVVFVRGSAPNRVGWIANPSHDPNGAERAIWAVRAAGGPAFRLAEGAAPEVSPDGRYVLYVKDGQIFRARTAQPAASDSMDLGLKPFIKEWGRQASPRWSPDGSAIAFVSDRETHALIGVYDVKTRRVNFIAPSVDCDGSPTWSPDGKRIAFTRHPGVPFGMQTQEGNGGIGNPQGVAFSAARGGGRGGPARRLRRVRRWWWWRRRTRPRRRLGAGAAARARTLQRRLPRWIHAVVHGRGCRDRKGAGVLAQPAE